MKPYLKSFLLIVFGLPLLIACLMIAAALLNGDLFMDLSSPKHRHFYASLLLILWGYCLPAAATYILLAIWLKLQRGWRGAGVSAALGLVLAISSIVLGEMFWGDGFVEWGPTLAIGTISAFAAAVMSLCLPKRGYLKNIASIFQVAFLLYKPCR